MTSGWTAADMPSLDGRIFVVTGANSGIGFEATRAFAAHGGTVVMACRSVDRGNAAAEEIRSAVPGADLDVRECDLGSLASIESFTASFRSAYDELDCLCNNAGVMALPRGETENGFEQQFGINHLGHFALTGQLLGVLARTGDARVVTQSSGAHESGRIDFDDLQREASYSRWGAYAQSKLANVCFGYELDRRASAAAVDLTSVVCHPGYADTDLQRRAGAASGGVVGATVMRAVNALLAQSSANGALPLLFSATDDALEGGEYVGPGGFLNMRGTPAVQSSSDRSYDEDTADRLWKISEELTGIEYDFENLTTAD